MSDHNGELTSNASPSSNAALFIIDMISDFEFEDGEKLFENALPLARNLAEFKREVKQMGIPVVYVNDNHGRWREDFGESVEDLINSSKRGSMIAQILRPEKDDYHIIKPQRSGFYATPLGSFLIAKNISNLIISGVTTDICVLLTALDAQMRGYNVYVPADCTAAVEQEYHDDALKMLERVAEADIRPRSEIDLNSFTNYDTHASPRENHRPKTSSDFRGESMEQSNWEHPPSAGRSAH